MAGHSEPKVVIPGDTVPSEKSKPGLGAHIYGTGAQSSLSGRTNVSKTFISIQRPSKSSHAVLPSVGDVILGMVTRTGPRFATIDILAITSIKSPQTTLPLPYAHQALIRQQDIRATEIDKVTVSGSFKVGDIVRGTVISTGDERNYYVSTAGDEMGVVLGRSEMGEDLVGVSWKEMIDGEGNREPRKAAKVI